MNTRFISGDIYNLNQLFADCEGGKIIIPDLQRDYCWGNTGNLVEDLVKNIREQCKTHPDDELIMGLLYGYYEKVRPYLQLCDGQQRLTTLFLLMGLINRKCGGDPFRKILISDYESEEDDKEPNLIYSIRDSSLYFLSDLVCNFFLGEDDSDKIVSEYIRDCDWWVMSYENDSTIQSMLAALDTINNDLPIGKDELKQLGNYVSENLKFMFYDMGTRQNGEETFVVINTTGEPLTANQNLKPLFIEENGMIDGVAEMWEDMETWFWQNRKRGKNHTADQGMKEFFRVVRIICANDKETLESQIKDKDSAFPYKSIDGLTVFDYFEAYKKIYGEDYTARKDGNCEYTNENGVLGYTDKYLFVLLPVLVYCRRFTDATPTDIKRVYHLFSNMSRYRSNEASLLWGYLQSIGTMADKDVCSLMECERIPEEERRKFRIIALQPNEKREEVELLFAEAEAHKIFDGQISLLLDWSGDDIKLFDRYSSRVKKLWKGNCDNNIDVLRRALLSYGLENYPIYFKYYETIGWDWEEWYDIFGLNKDKIRQFLDDERTLDEIINSFTDEGNLFYQMIKDEQYLSASVNKRVHVNKKINAVILYKKKQHGVGSWLFFNGKEYSNLNGGWANFRIGDESIFTTHEKGLHMHYYFEGNKYITRLYQREYPNKEKLDSIIELGLTGHENPETSYQNYWETGPEENWEKAKEKMEAVARWVDDNIK